MFHFKLLELESELIAKEMAGQSAVLTPECDHLLQFIEAEVGLKLADRAPKDWRGWISSPSKELIGDFTRAFFCSAGHVSQRLPGRWMCPTDKMRSLNTSGILILPRRKN